MRDVLQGKGRAISPALNLEVIRTKWVGQSTHSKTCRTPESLPVDRFLGKMNR